MKTQLLWVIGLTALLVIAGCNKPKPETNPVVQAPINVQSEPRPAVEQVATTGNSAVDSVGATVADISATESDLSDPALENLEKDLSSLDW